MKILKIALIVLGSILILVGLVSIAFLILGFRPAIAMGEEPHWESLNFAMALVGTVLLPVVIFVAQMQISKHYKKTYEAHKEHADKLDKIGEKLSHIHDHQKKETEKNKL